MGKLWILAASLTLNVALGLTCYFLHTRAPRTLPVSAAAPAALVSATRPAPVTRTNNVAVVIPAARLDWRAIESDDYKQYLANLRAAGCPEKTVRDVIIADINELYRRRFREFFPPTNRVQYWKSGNPLADFFDETRIGKDHELRKEKRELVKALLGSDYADEDDHSAIQLDSYSERLLDFLTPEKRTAIKELDDQFEVKLMKTYKDSWRGNDGPADIIRAEKDEAMLKVLTPEEKFEFDLRKSETAAFVRVGLGKFEVSEQEYRALFPAIKVFLTESDKPGFGAMMLGQPDPRPDAGPARARLREKIEAAFGTERFHQFIEQSGWNFEAETER